MAEGKVMEAVINFSGNLDPSVQKAIDGAQKQLKGLNLGAIAVGAAVGGIAVATGKMVLEAGKYLKDLGAQFDEASDSIRIGTGATGEALEGLLDDFDEVYKSIPTDMESVSTAVADFNTQLDLTGPALQTISKQAIQVSDMLGEDLNTVIEGSSKALQQWGVDAEDMEGSMDFIFKTSQSTGIGFTELMDTMQKFGPQLQEMGYSFEEAAALTGQLEKAGVNTDEVLGAMKKSVGALANEGIGAAEGLQMYYEKIQNAGTAAEAAAIANEVFGKRAGSTMAAAIRDGSLAVDDLTTSLMENDETIAGAAEDTYDFAERLQVMKNNLDVALKPIANTVFDGLNSFMPVLQKLLEKITPALEQAVDAAMPFVENFLVGAADGLEELVPMIADLGVQLLPILLDLITNLLPPLLSLARELLPPLMSILTQILPPITSLILSLLPLIVQIVQLLLPPMLSLIQALLPAITPILEILTTLLTTVVLPLLPLIIQIVETLLPPLLSIVVALMPAISAVLSVLSPIAEILGVIVGWVGQFVEWVAGGLTWVIDLVFGSPNTSAPSAPGFATGGFTDGFSIAGEDPRYPTEAVLSFNPAYRQQNLGYWAKAGRMLGALPSTASITATQSAVKVFDLSGISWSPVIQVSGNAEPDDILEKLKKAGPEFRDMLIEILEEWDDDDY